MGVLMITKYKRKFPSSIFLVKLSPSKVITLSNDCFFNTFLWAKKLVLGIKFAVLSDLFRKSKSQVKVMTLTLNFCLKNYIFKIKIERLKIFRIVKPVILKTLLYKSTRKIKKVQVTTWLWLTFFRKKSSQKTFGTSLTILFEKNYN